MFHRSAYVSAFAIALTVVAADIEKQFDTYIDPAEMGGWMKTMAVEPNHVGSAHDKLNADVDTYAAMIGKALNAHADKLDEGVALMGTSPGVRP